MAILHLELDVAKPQDDVKQITGRQGETELTIRVTVNDHKKPYDMSGKHLEFNMTRPDGAFVRTSQNISLVSGSTYDCKLPVEATALAGKITVAYFAIRDDEDEAFVDTTEGFIIFLDPSATYEAKVGPYFDQVDALLLALTALADAWEKQNAEQKTTFDDKIQQLETQANAAVEEVKEKAQQTFETNEQTRQSTFEAAEQKRQEQETAREKAEQARVAAEEKRESDIQGAISKAEAAATKATDAAGEASTAAGDATDAAGEARAAVESITSTNEEIEAKEAERQANEKTRQEQESAREAAEALRESKTTEAAGKADTAASKAEESASKADTAAQTATEAASAATQAKDDLTAAAEAGDFNGATFTPTVDGEGYISWENDKELPNPEKRNVKGPKGDQGEGLKVLDVYASYEELTAAHPTADAPGDAYLAAGHYYVWNGQEWKDAGELQGPPGEPGKDAVAGIATTEVAGIVKPDGETIVVADDGTISVKPIPDEVIESFFA